MQTDFHRVYLKIFVNLVFRVSLKTPRIFELFIVLPLSAAAPMACYQGEGVSIVQEQSLPKTGAISRLPFGQPEGTRRLVHFGSKISHVSNHVEKLLRSRTLTRSVPKDSMVVTITWKKTKGESKSSSCDVWGVQLPSKAPLQYVLIIKSTGIPDSKKNPRS